MSCSLCYCVYLFVLVSKLQKKALPNNYVIFAKTASSNYLGVECIPNKYENADKLSESENFSIDKLCDKAYKRQLIYPRSSQSHNLSMLMGFVCLSSTCIFKFLGYIAILTMTGMALN